MDMDTTVDTDTAVDTDTSVDMDTASETGVDMSYMAGQYVEKPPVEECRQFIEEQKDGLGLSKLQELASTEVIQEIELHFVNDFIMSLINRIVDDWWLNVLKQAVNGVKSCKDSTYIKFFSQKVHGGAYMLQDLSK